MTSLGLDVPDIVLTQGPDEDLDYLFSFVAEMTADGGTTIDDLADVSVTPTKITGDGTDFEIHSVAIDPTTQQKVTAWCRGGSDGDAYDILCVVTTSGGQVYERSFRLNIERN